MQLRYNAVLIVQRPYIRRHNIDAPHFAWHAKVHAWRSCMDSLVKLAPRVFRPVTSKQHV